MSKLSGGQLVARVEAGIAVAEVQVARIDHAAELQPVTPGVTDLSLKAEAEGVAQLQGQAVVV